jgi:hypothetical protein
LYARTGVRLWQQPALSFFSQRGYSLTATALASHSQFSSFVNQGGHLQYLQAYQSFPYYTPLALPKRPVGVENFVFNSAALSPGNPFGRVTEGCSHAVYRARSLSGKIYYIKDLSESVHGMRDESTAQYIAHQETFATWLMYQIFGPELIPEVFPVKFKNKWGLASSEMKYFGTLHQLARQLGHSELEIADGESALRVLNGQTFLLLPQGKEPLRVKGRIALKVALHLLVAHYDKENSHKNIFMKLISDPLHYRQVACPGMFDLGCVFDPAQMQDYIEACSTPSKKAELAAKLALNPVDAHIPELNVQDYEKITDRFFAKQAAFKRLAGLPRVQLETGLEWFKANAPAEAQSFIDDKIKKYLFCSSELALLVFKEITQLIQKEALPEKAPTSFKPN